eukprot:4123231-Amphidinium_carterae.1
MEDGLFPKASRVVGCVQNALWAPAQPSTIHCLSKSKFFEQPPQHMHTQQELTKVNHSCNGMEVVTKY